MEIRTRFAPSPTGYMHIGNLRTALYEYLIAKKENGEFILRIEDTDQTREVKGATDFILDILDETGLHYDEGPYIQSQRLDLYHQYALKLIELGGAHYCFCQNDFEHDPCTKLTSKQIQEKLNLGIPYVIRQTIPQTGTTSFDDEVYGHIEVNNNTLNESVLIKSDGYPTYNFANVIDDHLMNITHVIRGNEYLSSTPKYNLIYQAFGWDIPTYIHLPSVNKDETHKLSKRNSDASYMDLRKQGYLKDAIINYIALLGWSPENQEIFTLDELVNNFSIEHISKSPSIFDINKLKWMNGIYIRNMSFEEFHELAKTHYQHIHKDIDFIELSKVLQQRIEKLNDIEEMTDFINQTLPFDISLYTHKKMKTNPTMSIDVLNIVYNQLIDFHNFDSDDKLSQLFISLAKENHMKNGQIMWPIRVALTNKAFTPGGAVEIAHILGKDETLKRIQTAIQNLTNTL